MNEKNSIDWQYVYGNYSPKLLGICRRYIQDIYTAEDIVQDSFIAAIQNKHQLRDEKLLFAWLKKIVVNNALQYIRKSSKDIFTTTEISEIPDTLSEMSDPVSEEKKHIFIYDFTREELLLSIDHLPSHHKSVFNLFCIENYSHAEISSALGISVNTSKSHLLRAKKSIQTYLLNNIVDENTPKNKKKTVQLLVFLGFGGLLWAQTFRRKFSDFNIAPSKEFKIAEKGMINFASFSPTSNQTWKKKIVISSTILLIITASIFILKPKNNLLTKENVSITSDEISKDKSNKNENVSQKKPDILDVNNSSNENLNQTNTQTTTSEAQLISKEKNTEKSQKLKKIILKDSVVEAPKKVIVVKKIIQRDTIFIER